MKSTETTKRIVKIIIDGKHVKSFPLFMKDEAELIPETIVNTLSAKLVLSDTDCAKVAPFVFKNLCDKFLDQLKKDEKYIWELTINNPIEGVRAVNCRVSKKRTELVFKNNSVKISCPEYLYKFAITILPTVNLNY